MFRLELIRQVPVLLAERAEQFGDKVAFRDDHRRRVRRTRSPYRTAGGPLVITGYHNRREATAEALRDGWYRTGDLARRDANGSVTISGCTKELIIRGGESIYPAEVEQAFRAAPGVADAAVVGQAHPDLGEGAGRLRRTRTPRRPERRHCADRVPLPGFPPSRSSNGSSRWTGSRVPAPARSSAIGCVNGSTGSGPRERRPDRRSPQGGPAARHRPRPVRRRPAAAADTARGVPPQPLRARPHPRPWRSTGTPASRGS